MHARRALFVSMLVALPVLSSGCAGNRIRAAYAERQARPVEVLRPPEPAGNADQAPYQVGFRVSPRLMDQVLTAMLSKDLLEGTQFKAMGMGQGGPNGRGGLNGRAGNGQGDNGQRGNGQENEGTAQQDSAQEGPVGPLAMLARRFRERMGGRPPGGNDDGAANGGLMGTLAGLTGSLTPTLHAQSVRVGFTGDCNGCVKVGLDLEGGLGSPALNVALGGQVMIKGRVTPTRLEGRPALGVQLQEVESLHLDLPITLPGPFSNLQTRLEDALRDRMTGMLQDRQQGPGAQVMSLDRFHLGPGVELEGLGLTTAPSPNGELFLGLNTNLNARGAVTFPDRGGPMPGADWGIVVGDEVVHQLINQSIQSGSMPTRFDRKGRPDPEGPVALEIDDIHFVPGGFRMAARIWYLKSLAWWRDYTIVGTLELQDGQLAPRVTRMEPGAGDGATWVSRFVEHRVSSERAVRKLGKTLPDEMPLPMTEDKVARLTPTGIKTLQGKVLVYGRFDVMDKVGTTAGTTPGGTAGSMQEAQPEEEP